MGPTVETTTRVLAANAASAVGSAASATTSGQPCADDGSSARVRSNFSRDRPDNAIRTSACAAPAR